MLTPEASVKSFYDFLKEKKIMGTKCKDCRKVYLPPRPICPECIKSEMEWVKFEGKGKLKAFTSISVAPTHMLNAGYTRDNPYIFGVVQLDSGPSISAIILNVDAKNPENIAIDSPMTVEFVKIGEKVLLGFKPA